MKPDYNDVELGSHPSHLPHNGNSSTTASNNSSHYHHEESLITKTTDLAVFVSDRRPSDDQRLEKEESFEYDSRHH